MVLALVVHAEALVVLCIFGSIKLEEADSTHASSLLVRLPVAVGAIEAQDLVGEPKRAHPRLGLISTALSGGGDGEAHAAVLQPAPVTSVVAREAPGRVELANQSELCSFAST